MESLGKMRQSDRCSEPPAFILHCSYSRFSSPTPNHILYSLCHNSLLTFSFILFTPFFPIARFLTVPSRCLLRRFVTIYHGPSHTYKVQRLIESSSYSFRIQAISDAGEGPFSDTHTFCTTKSVPPALKGTLNPLSVHVSWRILPF